MYIVRKILNVFGICNTSLKRYRRDKDKFWAILDKNPSVNNLLLALHGQEKYESVEISAMVKYEKKITANLRHTSKPFFSYLLRSKHNINSTVSSLKRDDGSETIGVGEAAFFSF